MNAEIVAIGTELLLGEIVDTNSNHIARTLRDIGVNVFYMTAVGDNRVRIADTLRLGLSRSDLIITTGGLGPTVDDMTRQAAADATDRDLVFVQALLDQIKARFASFGVPMSKNNEQQAYVPRDAVILENEVGTAPCFVVESEHGIIISLPGVPREMKHILAQKVIPYLQQKMGHQKVIKALVLKTAGIGESHLDEKIADLMTNANPTIGLAAHIGQTDIRITALADDESAADTLIHDMEVIIRERVGQYIYGTGTDPIEQAVVALLQASDRKVIIVEAGTDGSLYQRISEADTGIDIIHSHHYFDTLETLRESMTLEDNAPLDLMIAAAQAKLSASDADICIAIGTEPSGTAIVVQTHNQVLKRSYNFGGAATQAPTWSTTWGLSMAWRALSQKETSE